MPLGLADLCHVDASAVGQPTGVAPQSFGRTMPATTKAAQEKTATKKTSTKTPPKRLEAKQHRRPNPGPRPLPLNVEANGRPHLLGVVAAEV
jgi:hypothetical protein